VVHVRRFLFVLLLLVGGVIGACGRTDQKTLPPDGGSHLFGFGPNPSPACLVSDNGGGYVAAAPNGINVTAGDTVTVKLASYAGVRSWQLTVFGLDELSTAPALTYSAGPPANYSFTFPNAAGRTVLLQSVVNGGTNVNGVKQSSYATTIGIFTLTASSGQRVLATGETFETCLAGWICDVNAQTRANNNGVYGGLYSSTSASLVLTTALTTYQVTFDSTSAPVKNTSISSNGVKVAIAAPVWVSASVSLNTGTNSTIVELFIEKNGTPISGAVGIANTFGATTANASTVVAFQTLVNAAVNDVFTVWATATNNAMTMGYQASLAVFSPGTLQGVAGPAGPPGPPSVIGGGACGAPVSGAVTLPTTTGCIAVDLTSVDATVDVSTVTPYDGLAYQFDLQAGTKSILFSGGTFVSVANGSTTPLSTMSVQGGGQSVTIKYNAANTWWTTP
jgi:hypothetical protein